MRICIKCGSINSDNAGFCTKCGKKIDSNMVKKSLNIPKTTISQSDSSKKIMKSNNKSYGYIFGAIAIGGIIIAISVVLVLLLTKPDLNDVKQQAISQMDQYSYEGELVDNESDISVIEEENSITEYNYICEITRMNSKIEIKNKVQITCERKFFGWYVGHVIQSSDPVCQIKEDYAIQLAEEYFDNMGYEGVSDPSYDYGDGVTRVNFKISQKKEMVSFGGNIQATIKGIIDNESKDIYLDYSIDGSQCNLKWNKKNLDATWESYVGGIDDSYFNIDIDVVGKNRIDVELAINKADAWWGRRTYSYKENNVALPDTLDELFISMNNDLFQVDELEFNIKLEDSIYQLSIYVDDIDVKNSWTLGEAKSIGGFQKNIY